ncbi:lytic murein transglycosylase [Agrobacterium sp. MS2]|nr:lytic murein transglycosylase [Agrobacterium sp. MS2]
MAFAAHPLCPAGHLPLKGGDLLVVRCPPLARLKMKRSVRRLPISPLEGEMPGRAEGSEAAPSTPQCDSARMAG